MKRLALLLMLITACARNGQPGFPPMPEARQGQIELDPQEATKKLAEAMTAAGLPVDEVATREGFVSTAWYDTTTKKQVGGRALGADDVRIRAAARNSGGGFRRDRMSFHEVWKASRSGRDPSVRHPNWPVRQHSSVQATNRHTHERSEQWH